MYNPVTVIGTTLSDVWFRLLVELNEKGRRYKITEGSHKGEDRVEFDMCSGFINHPHERPLAPILPPHIEAVPTTNDYIEKYFNEDIMNPNILPEEEYRYSQWINEGLYSPYKKEGSAIETPIEWVIRHFKEKGYGNNHCFINIGDNKFNFRYDKPYTNEKERGTSPCLKGLDFKIKDGKLLIGVIYRSWDLYSGWPSNMGGFTLLNEYVCGMLGDVEPGAMTFFSMGLHCYSHQIKAVMQVLGRE